MGYSALGVMYISRSYPYTNSDKLPVVDEFLHGG